VNHLRRYFSIAGLLTGPAPALAADPGLALGGDGETVTLAIALVKVFLSLAVVIILLVAAVALVRKLGLGRTTGRGSGLIRVVDSRMIAPKKYVAVVEVGGDFLALGITDQNISMLGRLEKTEQLASYSADKEEFGSILARMTGRPDRAAEGERKDDAHGRP